MIAASARGPADPLTKRVMRCSKEAIVQFLLHRLLISEQNTREIEEIVLDRQLEANQKQSEAQWKKIQAIEKQADELRKSEKYAEYYRLMAELMKLRNEDDRLHREWAKLLNSRFPKTENRNNK